MKLTETKQLNWANLQNLDYLYYKKGRKQLGRLSNNSSDVSKAHLGVSEGRYKDNHNSPTYKTKPHGRKQATEIFKSAYKLLNQNITHIPSIFDVGTKKSKRGLRMSKKSYKATVGDINNHRTSLHHLKSSKLKLSPIKHNCSNILNTRDIDGAVPAKFKHRSKRLVTDKNNKSHISFENKLVGDDGSQFKPCLRVYNPYKND